MLVTIIIVYNAVYKLLWF